MLNKKLGRRDVIGLKVRFGKAGVKRVPSDIGKPELKVEKKKRKK